MPNYRRARIPGGTYFFTVVTYQRKPLFAETPNQAIFQEVLNEVVDAYPCVIDGWVVLPDHLHCIWTLSAGDSDYSKRWGLIKAKFSKRTKAAWDRVEGNTESRLQHREAPTWQRRFWEHQIRDDGDYRRHMDYIHYNPVKHGLVKRVRDWPYSSFHKCCHQGTYPVDWCDDTEITFMEDFGE